MHDLVRSLFYSNFTFSLQIPCEKTHNRQSNPPDKLEISQTNPPNHSKSTTHLKHFTHKSKHNSSSLQTQTSKNQTMAETDLHLQVNTLLPEQQQEEHKPKPSRNMFYIKCYGCLTVLLLIPIATILLLYILFHVKNPIIKTNSISIQHPLNITNLHQNMTLVVNVMVQNPNYASIKYNNATTTVYCDGTVVGGGVIPAGLVAERKRVVLNVTEDVVGGKVSVSERFGLVNLSSYGRIDGKVSVFNLFKKNVVIGVNCSFVYSVLNMSIVSYFCTP